MASTMYDKNNVPKANVSLSCIPRIRAILRRIVSELPYFKSGQNDGYLMGKTGADLLDFVSRLNMLDKAELNIEHCDELSFLQRSTAELAKCLPLTVRGTVRGYLKADSVVKIKEFAKK